MADEQNKLTDEQTNKYIADPIFCPHCGSRHIESNVGLPSLKEIEAETECLDCKKKWTEVFILSKIYD